MHARNKQGISVDNTVFLWVINLLGQLIVWNINDGFYCSENLVISVAVHNYTLFYADV